MLVVVGSFRLDESEPARTAMREVTERTLRESGCLWYSYARDIVEPAVVRVSEGWSDSAALDAHLAAPHMDEWRRIRSTLGLSDRRMLVFETSEGIPL